MFATSSIYTSIVRHKNLPKFEFDDITTRKYQQEQSSTDTTI